MYRGKHETTRKGTQKFKKSGVLLASLLLVLALTVGTTVAYLMDVTGPVENVFQPVNVNSGITETITNKEKTSIIVTNDGDMPVYVRATMAIYWVDSNDIIVEPEQCSYSGVTVNTDGGWFQVGDIYYYKNCVSANGKTPNLLASPISATIKPEGADYKLKVEIHAEAIQATPTQAVSSAWGQDIAVNSDGSLYAKGGNP